MNLIDILGMINTIISVLFVLCYAYQFYYIFLALIKKPKTYEKNEKMNRFAVMIAARNEEAVVGNLIASIKAQTYPSELVDIFVVADNCTDNTAGVLEQLGVNVYTRFNTEQVGKGYAMQFLFNRLFEEKGRDYYDGYFIFDADNLLDPHFIEEMNNAFVGDNKVLTCYRNSKNFGDNWISGGYALWFLREAKYLNNPRSLLNTSCAVSGTGFLIHRDIINQNGGWKHFLLTEDIEFTIDTILKGYKVGYCHKAMLYDEQPIKFSQSWTQRLRWAKGYLQVFANYGGKMVKGMFRKNGYACFDMTMNIAPAVVFTCIGLVLNAAIVVLSILSGAFSLWLLFKALFSLLISAYLLMLFIGAITTVTEWKKIRATTLRKIINIFTFPIFMISYIAIAFVAFFKKVEWKQIDHTVSISIDELNQFEGEARPR